MSAQEIIEQIKALSASERAQVAKFVVENDDSWIPESFQQGMADAEAGRLLDLDTVNNECARVKEEVTFRRSPPVGTGGRSSPLWAITWPELVGALQSAAGSASRALCCPMFGSILTRWLGGPAG